MAIDRRQADIDLNAKMRLEAKLRPKLSAIDRPLVRKLAQSVGTAGTVPAVGAEQAAALEPVLLDHYDETGEVFSDRLSDQMPEDLVATDEETEAIAASLALLFAARAPEQARFIGQTTQEDAERAARMAETEAARMMDGDERPSRFAVGAIAGAIFNRSLAGRRGGIVTLETQTPAELSKQVEVEVLVGQPKVAPSELVPRATPSEQDRIVPKEWVSQGDSVVRDAHLDADSQQTATAVPFIVKGQRLMFPGDTSLGATIDNVINCRCASVIDPAPVEIIRRERLTVGL